MSRIDLRSSINAISDVINNRPRPKRQFDQIYMKTADMLLHAEHVSHHFADREVVFVGDGDAIGLCLMHLHRLGLLKQGPGRIQLLDFDEGIVNSVNEFAAANGLAHKISAELYNVQDPLPTAHRQRYGAFHINPPFGQRNGGRSVLAFLRRGVEALGEGGGGCVVIADDPTYPWTSEVIQTTQREIIKHGLVVAEMLPKFHSYHLDDAPNLTSCSIVVRLVSPPDPNHQSQPLSEAEKENFYGVGKHLNVASVPAT